MNFKFKKRHLFPLSICLSGTLYLNSLFGDFVYDDSRAIVTNGDVLGSTSLLSLFSNDYWGTSIASSNSHGSYRPISVLSFRLNNCLTSLAGGHTLNFHVTNILLHILVTWLYMRVLSMLILNRRIVGTSTMLFATHPIHVEAVSSLVGRAELLSGVFFLLSILSYVQYIDESDNKHRRSIPQRGLYLGGCAAFAALSMLSKELGILVLPVCVLYHIFFVHRLYWPSTRVLRKLFWNREYSSLRNGCGFLSVFTILLILFRTWIANFKAPTFSTADNPTSKSSSVITRFLTFLYLPLFNFFLLLYPQKLSFDWSMDSISPIRSIDDSRNLLTLFFYSCLVYGFVKIFTSSNIQYSGKISSKTNDPVREELSEKCRKLEFIEDMNNNNSLETNYNLLNNNINNEEVNSNFNNSNNMQEVDSNTSSFPNLMAEYEKTHPFIPQPQKYPTGYIPETDPKKTEACQKKFQDSPKNLKQSKVTAKLSQTNLIMLSLILLIVPFIPVTNLFFYVGFVVAERILYIPSFGYCLLIAIGFETLLRRLSRYKRVLKYCFALTVISLALRTFIRNFDWNSEEALYRSGLDVNPAKAYANLASVLDRNGNKFQAEQAYHQALIYRPNMADVHYNLGLLCQGQKRFDEATACYENAIQYRPKFAQAYLNLGWILAKKGKILRAMELYRQCTRIEPSGMKNVRELISAQVSALYNLGKLQTEAGDHEKALSAFEQAIDRLPDAEIAYPAQQLFNIVGETLLKMGKLNDAELWFRRAMTLSPRQLSSQLTWAKFLVRQNRTMEAEKVYLSAVRNFSNNSVAYEHYGHFLSRFLRYERAAEIYRAGIELDSRNYELVIGLADTLRELKQNKEAEKYFELAVKLRSSEPRAHSNLGAMYHYNGKYELAEHHYMIALKLRPDDNITQINLAKLNSRTVQK